MSLVSNMLSRLVIAFLPRSKRLNFMAAVTICSDFGAQENNVSHCFHFFHWFPTKREGKQGWALKPGEDSTKERWLQSVRQDMGRSQTLKKGFKKFRGPCWSQVLARLILGSQQCCYHPPHAYSLHFLDSNSKILCTPRNFADSCLLFPTFFKGCKLLTVLWKGQERRQKND